MADQDLHKHEKLYKKYDRVQVCFVWYKRVIESDHIQCGEQNSIQYKMYNI